MADRILLNEFKALSQEKWVNVELINENIRHWSVALMVINPASLYYGGYFKSSMTFPENYPYSPPTFQFSRPLYHPNIYCNGKLCISILHTPGEDATSGERASERWSPVQRVESVLLSIISLLDDAEVSSPANVDAGVMLRNNPAGYKARVKVDVEKSKEDIPRDFVMPTHENTVRKEVMEKMDDAAFWVDSGNEEGFGGSDTDAEMTEGFDADDVDQEDEDAEDAEDDAEEAGDDDGVKDK